MRINPAAVSCLVSCLLTLATPAAAQESTQPVSPELLAELRAAGVPLAEGGFGPNVQLTTLSANSWQPEHPERVDFSVIAVTQHDPALATQLNIPLNLPNGAFVEALCAWARDLDGEDVVLWLTRVEHDGSPDSNELSFDNSVADTEWQLLCSDPDVTVRALEDVDGDGTGLPMTTYALSGFFNAGGTEALLGPVLVFWNRQVSPAPATATFGDVPTSHPFFAYVEALAASGITSGCGSGNFCPNQPLNRGQMAVFLAKALGLHWPN